MKKLFLIMNVISAIAYAQLPDYTNSNQVMLENTLIDETLPTTANSFALTVTGKEKESRFIENILLQKFSKQKLKIDSSSNKILEVEVLENGILYYDDSIDSLRREAKIILLYKFFQDGVLQGLKKINYTSNDRIHVDHQKALADFHYQPWTHKLGGISGSIIKLDELQKYYVFGTIGFGIENFKYSSSPVSSNTIGFGYNPYSGFGARSSVFFEYTGKVSNYGINFGPTYNYKDFIILYNVGYGYQESIFNYHNYGINIDAVVKAYGFYQEVSLERRILHNFSIGLSYNAKSGIQRIEKESEKSRFDQVSDNEKQNIEDNSVFKIYLLGWI